MTYKTIRIGADLFAALKAAKGAAGCKTMGKYVARLMAQQGNTQPNETRDADIEREVERRVAARTAESTSTRTTGTDGQPPIEVCARALIDRLPEAIRDLAYEVCESVLHIQPSQLIYGHLMAVADAGRLQAPQIDPSWETNVATAAEGASICEWPDCRQAFTPARHGQRFCSNQCGGKAATAALPPPRGKTLPILEAPEMQHLIAV